MNCDSFSVGKTIFESAATLVIFGLMLSATSAQTTKKSTPAVGGVAQAHAQQANVQQELVRTETGFFEAWKMKDPGYFRDHIPENGVFWGEYGTASRDQQLAAQEGSAKVCTVEGYGLSDFGALPLAAGVYLLTYKAEQYATCNGEKVPVHMNGSSVYILKSGRWQAIYRAEVPAKN
jgi:hypothetical protein